MCGRAAGPTPLIALETPTAPASTQRPLPLPLTPARCPTHPTPQLRCRAAGAPKQVLELASEALPAALEWGEVLLSLRYAPVNPADL